MDLSYLAQVGARRLPVDDAALLRASGAALSIVAALTLGAGTLNLVSGSAEALASTRPWLFFGALVLPASLTLTFLASPRRTAAELDRLAVSYSIFVGAVIAAAEWLIAEPAKDFRGISWLCMWLIAVPLIIPMSRRGTQLTLVGLTLVGPLSAAGAWLLGRAHPATANVVMFYVANGFSAVGAWFLARMTLHLRKDLRYSLSLGDYKLRERISQGALSEVWLGEHRLLSRPAAIKLVRIEAGGEDAIARKNMLTRFNQEALALARLRSPYLIELYDYGIGSDGRFYYVMELIRGLSARAILTQASALAPRRVLHIWRQALQGLEDAHLAGVTHGALSLDHIYLTHPGIEFDAVKLGGFRARATHSANSLLQMQADFRALGSAMRELLGQLDEPLATTLAELASEMAQVLASPLESPERLRGLVHALHAELDILVGEYGWSPDEAEAWWYATGLQLEAAHYAPSWRRLRRDSLSTSRGPGGLSQSGTSQSARHWAASDATAPTRRDDT